MEGRGGRRGWRRAPECPAAGASLAGVVFGAIDLCPVATPSRGQGLGGRPLLSRQAPLACHHKSQGAGRFLLPSPKKKEKARFLASPQREKIMHVLTPTHPTYIVYRRPRARGEARDLLRPS